MKNFRRDTIPNRKYKNVVDLLRLESEHTKTFDIALELFVQILKFIPSPIRPPSFLALLVLLDDIFFKEL